MTGQRGERPVWRRVSWQAPLASVVLAAGLLGLVYAQGHATADKTLQALALVVVFNVALVALQLRSDMAKVISGDMVDERWATIHRSALAAAAGLTMLVGIVAFAVLEVTGRDNAQIAFMLVAIFVLYGVALVWYRWRT